MTRSTREGGAADASAGLGLPSDMVAVPEMHRERQNRLSEGTGF